MRERLPLATGLLTIAAVLAVVEALVRTAVINPYIVPAPSAIAASFWRILLDGEIIGRFFLTMGEMVAAGVLVTVVGVAAGVLLVRIPVLRQATEVWIAAFASAPVVLAYPLFLVVFGRTPLTVIMIAFVCGLAPVILKTIEGLSAVRPVLLLVGESFNLSRRQMFFKILLPAALPAIFVGIRLGLMLCLIVIVGVEFLVNLGGLGQLINELAELYDLPGTYAVIVFVVLVSVVAFAGLEHLEHRLTAGRTA